MLLIHRHGILIDMEDAGFMAVRRAIADLTGYLADLDPARITTSQAAELYSLFADVRRLGSAGEMLVATRAAKAQEWRSRGHRTAAGWMASTSGTGMGEAIATLETGERLETLPATAAALRSGTLSGPQAKEIAAAAARQPRVERELLKAADTDTLKGLKDRCRRVRAVSSSAAEENARYLAIHSARFMRHWSDADGAFRGEFKLTPDQGAKLLGALDRRASEFFDVARTAGRHEHSEAYAADALVDLVTHQCDGRATGTSSPQTVVHLRVDASALRRGYVGHNDVCEIAGIGPVPVATAQSLLPEAFVKVLVLDGVDIRTVAHIGRAIPARVRSAVEERDRTCVVPGCDVAVGLEIDHWKTDFAAGGATSLDNLARLCHFHHAMKTYGGFALKGGPGKWEWEPPPEFDSG